MKKLKKFKAKLQSVKTQSSKKLIKENIMKTNSGHEQGDDDFDSEFDSPSIKLNQDVQRSHAAPENQEKRVKWTDREDRYVVFCIQKLWELEGPASHECLAEVAKRVNKKFHNEKPIRNHSSLWWHIHGLQAKGAEVFSSVSIMAGAPSTKKAIPGAPPIGVNSRGNAMGNRTAEHQKISGAVRAPVVPVRPQVQQKLATKKSTRGQSLELIIKDASGNIERCSTNKFGSIEDLMFALA